MGFNPLTEQGVPLEKQRISWDQLNIMPYDKHNIHPYSRTRIILMNGIEVEGAMFSHQFARHATDPDLKQKLAMTRRIEQQQQKMVNWFPPADESVLEVTIGYEQVAVDLTAYLARTEPDPKVKEALNFALLEDFDHLYRYANLMEMTEGKDAERTVKDLTEIMPGRPTRLEHRHPFDDVRGHYDRSSADILTKLHVMTIVSGEQQTMNFYMNVGNRPEQTLGRGLYQEIAMVEEQHVTHYESLADPHETWFERLVLHEYNECYMYYSCMQSEPDERIRKFWQDQLECEIEHLKVAVELMKQYEKRDAGDMLPDSFPELTIFQSNKDYVRGILASETYLSARETEYVKMESLPDDYRYWSWQKTVNAGSIPSETVIHENRRKNGRDYRIQDQGDHPVEEMRIAS